MSGILIIVVVVLLIVVSAMLWKKKYHESYTLPPTETWLASVADTITYVDSNGKCITPADSLAVGWKLTNNASNNIVMGIRTSGPPTSGPCDVGTTDFPGMNLTGSFNLVRGQTLVCNDIKLIQYYRCTIPSLYQNCQVQVMNVNTFATKTVSLPPNVQGNVTITVVDDYTDPSGVDIQFS